MAGFKDIVGNEQIIEHLQNAIALGKVSHAYILNGPEKSGKMMIAEAFAMALQCEGEGERPCLHCRSCKQAIDHNQPDIIYVSHEKPNTIGVDDIRTQINNDVDNCSRIFSEKYENTMLILESANVDSTKLDNEIKSNVTVLKEISGKLNLLHEELLISISKSGDSEVEIVLEDMGRLIDSVKDY